MAEGHKSGASDTEERAIERFLHIYIHIMSFCVMSLLLQSCGRAVTVSDSYLLVSDGAPSVNSIAFCFSMEPLLELPVLSVNVSLLPKLPESRRGSLRHMV